MQTPYPESPAAHDTGLPWASPRVPRRTVALVFESARRRVGLRRKRARPEHPLRYMLRALAAFPRRAAWLGLIGESRALRAAAEANPRVYERWQRHHISSEFSLATRARVVEAHYRFMEREFPDRLRERLVRGLDVRLATLPLGGGEMAYLHARAPEDEATGEMGLFLLNGDKEVISSCAITFGGTEGLLVGAMRGSWAYLGRGAIARFTRATGGLRPRELLLAVIRALATFYGIDRVRAVSRAAHPLDRRAANAAPACDGFWRRHGGAPGPDGCFEIPHVGTSSGRPERDAFRRDACEAALRAFGGPIRSRTNP